MGKWLGIFLWVSSVFADCPVYLFAYHDAQKVADLTAQTAPQQYQFRNFGGYLEYFTTPAGEEVMFGAITQINGKVLTLSQITVLPLGASNYNMPVKLTVAGVAKARDRILAKAKAAGFRVVVMEGDRITGARKINGKTGPVSRLFFIGE